MIIARALQMLGLVAILGAAMLAHAARPEGESLQARAARLYCEAMAVSEPFVARSENRPARAMPACAPAPRMVWDREALTAAAAAALGGLLLAGFGQLIVNTSPRGGGRAHD
jgi:hypothetical protein